MSKMSVATKMKFSIGYNFDIKILDLLGRYQSYIEALYFPIPAMYLGSGRDILQPKAYIDHIPLIIKKCNALNIKSQILLNPIFEGKLGLSKHFLNNILKYLKKLQDIGLSSVIVVNPIYISRIRKELSSINIESSVNCFVRTIEHALYLKDLGVDVVTIDRDINRNIPLIKDIKNKTGLKIRIMLNEGCLSNCPYRIMHYNYLSISRRFKNPIEGVYYDKFCIEIYKRNPLRIFRVPFIPPEAVTHYTTFVDYYKLSTRTFPTHRIKMCLKAYIEKNFHGNLLTLLDCPGLSYFEYVDYSELKKNNFFKRILICTLECNKCTFCSSVFKKAVLISRDPLHKESQEEEMKAIQIYEKELKRCDHSDERKISYAMIGEACFKLGKYRKAIKNIKRALKFNYKQRYTYLILGLCYENLRIYKKAIAALRQAARANPGDYNAIRALARCYKKIGKEILLNRYIDKFIQVLKPELTKKEKRIK